MTTRLSARAGGIATALLAASVNVYAQQSAAPAGHAAHQPTPADPAPTAADQRNDATRSGTPRATLDELVQKMNAATGTAKTDAIAELLTAIVNDRESCAAKMADKMGKMKAK
jgi:hypothetical protein